MGRSARQSGEYLRYGDIPALADSDLSTGTEAGLNRVRYAGTCCGRRFERLGGCRRGFHVNRCRRCDVNRRGLHNHGSGSLDNNRRGLSHDRRGNLNHGRDYGLNGGCYRFGHDGLLNGRGGLSGYGNGRYGCGPVVGVGYCEPAKSNRSDDKRREPPKNC